MSQATSDITIRPIDELDLGDIVKIDEKVSGTYRPEEWETRVMYYLRRDPETSKVAVIAGEVVGFMLGDIRSGEFGLEEPTGWIEVLGVDPDHQGKSIGKKLVQALFDYFKSEGAHRVLTLVDSSMEEIGKFFESAGFEAASIKAYVKEL